MGFEPVALKTRWHCNQFLQKSPKSKLDNTFTLKKPFVTPNFCKQNLSQMHRLEIVNSFTFKITLVQACNRVPNSSNQMRTQQRF